MITYEITKTKKLIEQNNDMCHNYYYLINGRFYNSDKTKYKRFKYVEWFDILDLQEYFEKERITKEDIKQYISERSVATVEAYLPSLSEFYNYCNETIEHWNKLACYWGW